MNEYMPDENFRAAERSDALLQELKKKTETGNIIRSIGIGVVTVLGVGSLVIQAQSMNNIDRSMGELNRRVQEIQETTDNIAGDVYDILEQGCDGSSSATPVIRPIVPGDGDAVMKPVIYLYDDEPGREVHTGLKLHASEMLYMWPEAGTTEGQEYGWDMTTSEDGTLYDEDGNEYSYIFWEASDYGDHSFEQGFCVKGSDTAEFLREKLKEIGLTPREYNEFIVFWLPKMQDNAYNIIRFEGVDPKDDYNQHFELSVNDGEKELADSMLRVFMVWQASDTYQEIEPQEFQEFERNGFTVVEWGGTEVGKQ